MSDYANSKTTVSAAWPPQAIAAEVGDLEPIIGVDEIQNRHLFGLPLISQMKDPRTGKAIVMTPEIVKDIIEGAVRQAELDCRINITAVQYKEKLPFDRNLFEAYGYTKVAHKPITSLDRMSVTPSNQIEVYNVPLEWVEMGNAHRGQINLIPITASFVQGSVITGSQGSTVGAAFFLAILGQRAWIPAFWEMTYTSGFPTGSVPRIVNELIGTIAAAEILSMLAVTYARSQSHSLGIDGTSQSVSGPGPAIFQIRGQELEAKRNKLVKKIKNLFGNGLFSSNV
jgi:hypothetical protein